MTNLIEKCRRLAGNWTFNKEMTEYMAKNGKPGRAEDVDKTPLEDVSKDTVNSYSILLYYVHYCGKTSITISLISPRFSSPSPTTLRSSRMSPKITAGCHCIACCTCTWLWIVDHHFPPFSPWKQTITQPLVRFLKANDLGVFLAGSYQIAHIEYGITKHVFVLISSQVISQRVRNWQPTSQTDWKNWTTLKRKVV